MNRKAQLAICWIVIAGLLGWFVWDVRAGMIERRRAGFEVRENRTKAEREGFDLGFEFGLADVRDGVPHRGMDWKERIGRMRSEGSKHRTDFQLGFMNGYDEAFR